MERGGNVARAKHPYEPSPTEIRHACAEIQAGWSPETRKRRAVYRNDAKVDWELPVLSLDDSALPKEYIKWLQDLQE